MSIQSLRRFRITCNECSGWFDCDADSAREARLKARAAGWVIQMLASDHDLCTECVNRIRQRTPSGWTRQEAL